MTSSPTARCSPSFLPPPSLSLVLQARPKYTRQEEGCTHCDIPGSFTSPLPVPIPIFSPPSSPPDSSPPPFEGATDALRFFEEEAALEGGIDG